MAPGHHTDRCALQVRTAPEIRAVVRIISRFEEPGDFGAPRINTPNEEVGQSPNFRDVRESLGSSAKLCRIAQHAAFEKKMVGPPGFEPGTKGL